MSFQSVCLIFVLVLAVTRGLPDHASQANFNYNRDQDDPLGVYNWGVSFPDCAGTKQSPVNIITSSAIYNPYLSCPGFSFPTYDVAGMLTNNGHTVVFQPTDPMALLMFNLSYAAGKYALHEIHMHYGGQTNFDEDGPRGMYPGSEHLMNGNRYVGEIHKVFKPHSNDADEDLWISVSIFVEIVSDASIENHDFSDFLTRNIPLVRGINYTTAVTVDINMFHVPDCQYYTYFGSETKPNCAQNVRNIIYRTPIQVTQSAWNKLTLLQSTDQFVSMYGNYRPTQPLNNRVVDYYTPPISNN